MHNETETIRLLNAGSETAFVAVYDQFQPAIFQRAYRMVGNQAEAEDITAETFVKFWHARNSFTALSGIASWLRKTATNASLDLLKHRKIVLSTHSRLMAESEMAGEDWTTDDLMAEALKEIYRQIELLPEKGRQVFKLRYIEGLSNEEIALYLGIQHQTVRDHLSRALKFLRLSILEKKHFFSFFLLFVTTK